MLAVASVVGSGMIYAITSTLVAKCNMNWLNGVSLDDIPIGTNISNYYLVLDKTKTLEPIQQEKLGGMTFGLCFNPNIIFSKNEHFPILNINCWPDNEERPTFFAYMPGVNDEDWNWPVYPRDDIFYEFDWNPKWSERSYFQFPQKSILYSILSEEYSQNYYEDAFWDFIHSQKIYKTLPNSNEILQN